MTTSLDLSRPSEQSLAAEAQTWADKARGLRIVDQESCRNASYLLRSIKGLRSEIAAWFAPHIDAAMETKRKADAARKALVDEQAKMEAGLVDAEGTVKRALLAWEDTQERIRREEEHRLQVEAQRQAEALVLDTAAALEQEAQATGDTAMLQEAHDILAQPVEAPAVSVARMVPKVEGVTYRDNWTVHPTIDIKALAGAVASGHAPVAWLTPNLPALRQFARATKGTSSVPGVRFLNDRQIASRG